MKTIEIDEKKLRAILEEFDPDSYSSLDLHVNSMMNRIFDNVIQENKCHKENHKDTFSER